MSNETTISQFKSLIDKVEKKYASDFIREHGDERDLPTKSEMYGLPNYTEEDYRRPLSYYLLENKKVCKFLYDYYETRKDDGLLKLIAGENSWNSSEVKFYLKRKYNDKYVYEKYIEFVKKGKFKDDYVIKLKNLHKQVLELYISEYTSESEIKYDAHYFSATDAHTKTFELALDLPNRTAQVKGFHDNEEDEYVNGKVQFHDRLIYINLVRKTSTNDYGAKFIGDYLFLILYGGKDEDRIKDLEVMSGCFLGKTKSFGYPISSEVIFIRKDVKNEQDDFISIAERHLNLNRNRVRVFPGFQADGEDGYSREFKYNLSDVDLETMVGTYKIGRLYSRKQSVDSLLISIFRLNSDFSATLNHPLIQEEMRCEISINKNSNQQKILIVRAFLKENKYSPIIVIFIQIPESDQTETIGKYVGIKAGNPATAAGEVILQKLSSNSDFQLEDLKPENIKVTSISGGSDVERLYNRLKK